MYIYFLDINIYLFICITPFDFFLFCFFRELKKQSNK